MFRGVEHDTVPASSLIRIKTEPSAALGRGKLRLLRFGSGARRAGDQRFSCTTWSGATREFALFQVDKPLLRRMTSLVKTLPSGVTPCTTTK